ncbi:hypothetical protein SLE2022_201630 [Rubroshorea leprosula]
MGDHRSHHGNPRSSSTDHSGILSISKAASINMCKAYKSLVTNVSKWYPDNLKSSSHKSEEEGKFKDLDEAYKAANAKKQMVKFKNGEDSTEGSDHNRTIDENFFSHPFSLAKSLSRRSHTPSARSSYSGPLSKSQSRKSPQESDIHGLSRSESRNSPSSLSRSNSRRSKSVIQRRPSVTEIPSLTRSTSRSTTPIMFSHTTARRRPPPVEKKLECTLEELCYGGIKRIRITKDVISEEGFIVQEDETLIINLKPGWKKGTKVTFEGKGDEKPGYLPADIIFVIEEQRHPLFRRKGDDLEIAVEIPLVMALTGCSLSVPLLGGKKMSLSLEEITYPGYEKVIQGQGMTKAKEEGKRGDLRITFLVKFPTELTDQQRSEAYSILQDCTYD